MAETTTITHASPLAALIGQAGWLGVSGSRAPRAETQQAVRLALSLASPGATLLVGRAPRDAGGVDQVSRWFWRDRPCRIFDAGSMSAGALVRRSQGLAQAVARNDGTTGLLLVFPEQDLPLVRRGRYLLTAPTPRWVSFEPISGTWSTATMAAGLGAHLLVYRPSGEPGGGWGWRAVTPGWWYLPSDLPLAPVAQGVSA